MSIISSVVSFDENRLWSVIIRIVSIVLWIFFVISMISILRCKDRLQEGFSVKPGKEIESLVNLAKKVVDIEKYLKDENAIFNQLIQTDSNGDNEIDKMKKYIINKHKSIVEFEEKKKKDEIERKKKEEEQKKQREEEEKKANEEEEKRKKEEEIKRRDDEIRRQQERRSSIEEEPFSVQENTLDRIRALAVDTYIRISKCWHVVYALESGFDEVIESMRFIIQYQKEQAAKSKSKKESFLNYERLKEEEIEMSGIQTNSGNTQTTSDKPKKETVYSKYGENPIFSQINISPDEVVNRLLRNYGMYAAELENIERRAYVYASSLKKTYKFYIEDKAKFEESIKESVEEVKSQYSKAISSALQPTMPGTTPEMKAAENKKIGDSIINSTSGAITSNKNSTDDEKDYGKEKTASAISDANSDLSSLTFETA